MLPALWCPFPLSLLPLPLRHTLCYQCTASSVFSHRKDPGSLPPQRCALGPRVSGVGRMLLRLKAMLTLSTTEPADSTLTS